MRIIKNITKTASLGPDIWLLIEARKCGHLLRMLFELDKKVIWEVDRIAANTKTPRHWYVDNSQRDRDTELILQDLKMREVNTSNRDEMDNISQRTFSSIFSSMKMFEFRLKFHLSLFLRVRLTIFQHCSDNRLAPARRHKPVSEPLTWHQTGAKSSPEPLLTMSLDAI